MSQSIKTIKNFLADEKNSLLIFNSIEEKYDEAYKAIIQYYFLGKLVENHRAQDIVNDNHNTLFGSTDEIIVYTTNIDSEIKSILKKNIKKILITNYKNYKKLSHMSAHVNTFNFDIDIKFFIKNELGITNLNLLNNVINYPEYLSSEISKYSINDNYDFLFEIEKAEKDIGYIRKKIFNNKTNLKINLIDFYKLIMEERDIKKLNFLTY